MADIQITLSLFGAFRQFGDSVVLALPAGGGIADVKRRLAVVLGGADSALISASVLASDDEVLGASAVFDRDCQLAILPPVCGG